MRLHRPLLISLCALLLLVALSLGALLGQTGGRFVYALDDAYIHLALARNLASHGVFGITPDRFEFASSSPVFTLLLAAVDRVIGVHEIVPFVLDLILACALLALADRLLRRRGATLRARTGAGLALLLLTPLPALVFGGQEHLLHLLLTLAFADRAARAIADDERSPAPLLLLAALLPLVRFEGLFLIAVVGALLFVRGRRALAMSVVAAAVGATGLYALWATAHGGFALPNPVLIKGTRPDLGSAVGWLRSLGGRGVWVLSHAPALFTLVATSAILLARELARSRPRSYVAELATTFLATTLLHVQFAAVGVLFRYEAYLVAFGLVVIFAALAAERIALPSFAVLRSSGPAALVLVAALVVFFAPLGARGVTGLTRIPQAARDIHHQQFQMAAFLAEHYPGATVAVNDVGVLSFRGDVRCLDLWGVADRRVAAARFAGRYDTATIARVAAQDAARIAVVYEGWFERFGGLPRDWIKVGAWTLDRHTVVGGATVAFYAVDPAEAAPLAERLHAFAARLPRGVATSSAPRSPL